MNKRKPSADRNIKQKASSRRPSSTSLHMRLNFGQQKSQEPEKSPSIHNVVKADETSKMVSKGVDVCMPKTRFNSQDRYRSSSSPRLKYFPAEKIKKLETPPPFSPKPMGALIAQQDPGDAGVLYVGPHSEQRCDNGQGDATVAAQHLQYRQHPGTHTASQQQVGPPHVIPQVGQMNPHSESMLHHQLANVQSRRPFVPHGARDYSPQKNPQASFANPLQTSVIGQPGVQSALNSSGATMEQGRTKNEETPNVSEVDYQKQPIGGRNAEVYRKMVMASRQPGQVPLQTPMESAVLNQANMSQPALYSVQTQPTSYPNLQNPQQVYQQLQQNMVQQQQLQQRAVNYQAHTMGNQQQTKGGQGPHNYNAQQFGRYFPGQDAMATRAMGMSQNYPMHQRDLDYTIHPQNGWARNNQMIECKSLKVPLKSYNVDVVGGNQTYRVPNPQQSQAQQQQQLMLQQQQLMLQQQQPPVNQHHLIGNPAQVNAMMPRQQYPAPYSQPGFIQQMNPNQQTLLDQQLNQPQRIHSSPQTRRGKAKSPLKFTASMIRDQEKLLATMKQQGVPMDIMKRQFDLLLNEQRKHLEYLEMIQRQDESDNRGKSVTPSRKKKPVDQKPEWMVHLTPSWLSYMELEKMHEQERKQREAQQLELMRQQQQGMNEMSSQQVHVQAPNQQNFQQWQQSGLQQPHMPQLNTQQPNNNMQQFNWQRPQTQQFRTQQLNTQEPDNNMQQFNWQQLNLQQQQQQQLNWQQSSEQQQQQPRSQQQYNNVYPRLHTTPVLGNANELARQPNYPQNVPQYQYIHQQPHQQYYYPQQQQYQQFYQTVPQQRNQEQVRPTNHVPAFDENVTSTKPSSLLKLRQYMNEIRPQKQNNGLQDPEIAKRQLEDLRMSTETRKGLEYLANLAAQKKPELRLNGMQDRNEMEVEFQQQLINSIAEQPTKRVSSNGLENTRNPNNPPPTRLSNVKKMEQQEFLREYPRQKYSNPRNYYVMQAERENGTVAEEPPPMFVQQQGPRQNPVGAMPYNDKNSMMPRSNVMPYRFDSDYPQYYQQMQQYYQNTRNLARNNGEGDAGSAQKVEQTKNNFDHAAGDAGENVNGAINVQMADGKMPYHQRMYYSQPNIHEARTIGGVRYFARKPDYQPNRQIVSPETLIANRNMQPPMIVY